MFTTCNAYMYMLALNKCDTNDDFTIHGLWPQYSSTKWPQYCNNSSKLNMDNLQNLMPQIRKYWLTCSQFNHTEEWFLSHEWSKHGTCTPFTQEQYFGTALALYQMIPWRVACTPEANQCMMEVYGIV